ncbi:hypothetical protein C8Q72DRAFT_268855 [Fomitopsis betulina]|nr:hypothetical protein C8Q72DRAFT_268855 [Fomitopsis betulina]
MVRIIRSILMPALLTTPFAQVASVSVGPLSDKPSSTSAHDTAPAAERSHLARPCYLGLAIQKRRARCDVPATPLRSAAAGRAQALPFSRPTDGRMCTLTPAPYGLLAMLQPTTR